MDQNDLHQPELSVRETFDFAARCQGVGHKADELAALLQREEEQGITPDPALDAFMRAEVRSGKRESIVTDLVIKMLGLDVSTEQPRSIQLVSLPSVTASLVSANTQ